MVEAQLEEEMSEKLVAWWEWIGVVALSEVVVVEVALSEEEVEEALNVVLRLVVEEALNVILRLVVEEALNVILRLVVEEALNVILRLVVEEALNVILRLVVVEEDAWM
jgi:hypothetical protein